VLTRTTAVLAAAFFGTSLVLSILAGIERKPSSIIQGGPAQQSPGAPPLGQGGGVLDTLRQSEQPPPPAGPQAPRSQ
jgi:preprotein translocase subunit SecG